MSAEEVRGESNEVSSDPETAALLDEVLDSKLTRYAEALKRLGSEPMDRPCTPRTVFVLTEYREFRSLHRTEEGAEAARAALIRARQDQWAASPFETVRDVADEGPDTEIIEMEIQP